MLKGKILKIRWAGEFEVTIAGAKRVFDDKDGMHDWFSRIIAQSKDDRKRRLLMEDLKHMCDFSGH